MKLRLAAVVCVVSLIMSVAAVLYLQFVEPRSAAARPPGQGPGWFTLFCYLLITPGMFLMNLVLPREYTSMRALTESSLFVASVVITLNVVFWTIGAWLAAATLHCTRRPRVRNI